ncbi:Ribonuclease BN, tRNA processing enzyme [Malonomonas rubra DSM 5091]|uniref:Ribonuclease BN, tRNA processing enzyme n=1 Tax=Malonomonas rubra DSM 5091 TaxID=1122189 RepID=A0A1M6HBG1_MALRU|nr:MBL fold metallo-hydrolase [Malonomonas rubra]SHJ19588.1 Ribonuclease BN, tRNA processing enzyme [Malonomonas rubra DSM 5091]
MKTAELRCVGTGDAFGSGGRLNSCYHLHYGQEQLLLDCGCSSLIGLQRCGLDPAGIDAIVISHLHGDHFGGIPFLLLEAKFVSQRQRPLTLIGPPKLESQVRAAVDALYPGTVDDGFAFPLVYKTLQPGEILTQGCFEIGSYAVKHGSSADVFALQVAVGGKKIAYTGDSEWVDSLIDLAAGSEIMLTECFAYAHPVPSHLDYQTLLQKRDSLCSKRLLLTHMGPEMLAKIDELEFETVSDGDLIQL